MPAKHYNFGELLPASIRGQRLRRSRTTTATLDPGEPLLAGVTIYLLDGSGNRIASTTTDANGKYALHRPDARRLRRRGNPADAAISKAATRSARPAAQLDGADRILNATLASGVNGVNYDFWEVAAGEDLRLRVPGRPGDRAQAGRPAAEHPLAPRRQAHAPTTRGSPAWRCNCATAAACRLSDANGNPITTVTDANGYYEFTRLYAGRVFGRRGPAQPAIMPGIDTAGSNGGLVVNRYAVARSGDPQHAGGRSLGQRDRADRDRPGRRGGGVQLQRGAGARPTPPDNPPIVPPLPPPIRRRRCRRRCRCRSSDYRPMGPRYLYAAADRHAADVRRLAADRADTLGT